MCDKPDCLLKKNFRSLGWEICRRTGYTFKDIYIYWCGAVGEYVVCLKGKFAGYDEQRQQLHLSGGGVVRFYNLKDRTNEGMIMDITGLEITTSIIDTSVIHELN